MGLELHSDALIYCLVAGLSELAFETGLGKLTKCWEELVGQGIEGGRHGPPWRARYDFRVCRSHLFVSSVYIGPRVRSRKGRHSQQRLFEVPRTSTTLVWSFSSWKGRLGTTVANLCLSGTTSNHG